MKNVNVLIFPAGSENALEIYDSLRYNVNITLYGLSSKKDHAEFIYPKGYFFRGDYNVFRPEFVSLFDKFLREYSIDIVIPTHDTVALVLAENREKLFSKILTADASTANICRNKKLTMELFKKESFFPLCYSEFLEIPEDMRPIFIKPNQGEGAKGTFLFNNKLEISKKIKTAQKEYLFCEYLPGKEITVDCFTNSKGELTFFGARTRERIQMGIAFHSECISVTEEITYIAKKINQKLNMLGAWFFQLRKDKNNKYKLLEISCRQAGTMALYRQKGINFALLGVFEIMGVETSYIQNTYNVVLDRRLSTTTKIIKMCYKRVYVDFDDTLILQNMVNQKLIAFLYKCVNDGKKITLITRHEKDIYSTLRYFKICENLFDEIFTLCVDDNKCDYMSDREAIFIDNSYKERKEIANKLKMPVFDLDTINLLLDT